MVKILLGALFEGEFGEVLVVIVLLQDDDVGFRECLNDPAGDGGLP
jgi:hypothetical protein